VEAPVIRAAGEVLKRQRGGRRASGAACSGEGGREPRTSSVHCLGDVLCTGQRSSRSRRSIDFVGLINFDDFVQFVYFRASPCEGRPRAHVPAWLKYPLDQGELLAR
jgi:hypothetical protein